LIPYLFDLVSKERRASGNDFFRSLNHAEGRLVKTLIANSDGQATGIIGTRALNEKRMVKVKPTNIYWNGLRTYEIFRSDGISLSAACSIACQQARKKKSLVIKRDGETFDDSTAGKGNLVLFSPLKADYDFMKSASIELTVKEAEFLADRISKAYKSKDTLLSYLLEHRMNCRAFGEIPSEDLPEPIKKDYLRARDFADFIYGAHLRYNLIFSNYEDEKMAADYETWRSEFMGRDFDLKDILDRISVNYATRRFCEKFLDAVSENKENEVDRLIIARERAVKGARSKLCKPSEYMYDSDRPTHKYKLDYRFGTAKIILADIIRGLEGS
jgi:hypothetical protein